MHILLIEPDTILAKVYRQSLEAQGHTVARAVSAQDGVHTADTHRPDLVLLELQLPAHNGVEFLYEFRSYPEWSDIPVVIHTYVPPAELARFATLQRELGITRLLYKPATSLRQLNTAVQTAMRLPA